MSLAVHLDTDIGDDIDDVFCLALLLRCPEVFLRSITTVFAHAPAKADIAYEMCHAAGASTAVAAGFARPMTSRTSDALKRPHYYPAEPLPARHRADVPAALKSLLDVPADGAILTIGAMTNVAAALIARDPATPFPRVVAMAGEFQRYGHIEHNVRSDPEAAHLCFSSGVPIDFIPWSIGPQTKLTPDDVDRLRAAAPTDPLCEIVIRYADDFWKHIPGKTNMYDPMTVVALLRPDFFDWRRGTVSVELRGDATFAATRFHESDTGPHRVAFGVRADEARAWMMDRLAPPSRR
jgi:purine nucleosidase